MTQLDTVHATQGGKGRSLYVTHSVRSWPNDQFSKLLKCVKRPISTSRIYCMSILRWTLHERNTDGTFCFRVQRFRALDIALGWPLATPADLHLTLNLRVSAGYRGLCHCNIIFWGLFKHVSVWQRGELKNTAQMWRNYWIASRTYAHVHFNVRYFTVR